MFGYKVRKLREVKGLSQEQLAHRIGVTHAAVSQWENGRSFPRMGMVVKLADILGVEPSELVGSLDNGLSFDEGELLTAYRQLNSKGKARLLEDARTMIVSGLYAPAKNNQALA